MAKELLNRVGLSNKINDRSNTLSGGQKHRLAIVRTLAMEPEIIPLTSQPLRWTRKCSVKYYRSQKVWLKPI